MVEHLVFDIAIAAIAPVREVSEREANEMILILCPVTVEHVGIDVAAALHSPALWLEADPILTRVLTVGASVVHMNALEGFLGGDVLRSAMRAVFLGHHCVEALNV